MPTFALSRAALVLAGVTCLATVPPEAQDRPPAAQDRFVLEAGEHDVVDILTKAARFLDRNYVLAPAEMQGAQPVVLQRRIETDRTGCETLVGQLAFARGLALVPKDLALGLWDVINLAGPRRADVAANRTVVPPRTCTATPSPSSTSPPGSR
jgi:hypothetical protein